MNAIAKYDLLLLLRAASALRQRGLSGAERRQHIDVIMALKDDYADSKLGLFVSFGLIADRGRYAFEWASPGSIAYMGNCFVRHLYISTKYLQLDPDMLAANTIAQTWNDRQLLRKFGDKRL
jgi:hypothetical protein